MQVQYLEIVTPDVDATFGALEKLHGVGLFAIYIQGGIQYGLWQA